MFNKYSTLADVQIALEETYQAQSEAIAQAELVLKEMKRESKATYSKLLMLDELQGKGDYIEAYPKREKIGMHPLHPAHPDNQPDYESKWLGVGHSPDGEQY
jgi:hypothetical protein